MSTSNNVGINPPAVPVSNADVDMQDQPEDRKAKDLVQRKLGVSANIIKPRTNPRREKPKVIQPSRKPPAQAPQPIGLSVQEEEGELLSRFGSLRV